MINVYSFTFLWAAFSDFLIKAPVVNSCNKFKTLTTFAIGQSVSAASSRNCLDGTNSAEALVMHLCGAPTKTSWKSGDQVSSGILIDKRTVLSICSAALKELGHYLVISNQVDLEILHDDGERDKHNSMQKCTNFRNSIKLHFYDHKIKKDHF